NRGLPRASRQRQQRSVLSFGDPLQHAIDRDLLIKPNRPGAALVGEWNARKSVPPRILRRERPLPQLIGRRIGAVPFLPALHVDAIKRLAVGGISKSRGQLPRIILGLCHSPRQRLIPTLRLNHRQLSVAIDQHVISAKRLAAPTESLQPPQRDRMLAKN